MYYLNLYYNVLYYVGYYNNLIKATHNQKIFSLLFIKTVLCTFTKLT